MKKIDLAYFSKQRHNLITTVLILLMVGCASLGGIYPEDKGDICALQRGDLRRTEDFFVKQGVMNVLGGAAAGAALGALTAVATGRDAGSGAAIGAISGAGVGLLKTLYESINKENQQIEITTNAFNQLGICRFSAADAVRADFRAGRLNQQAATTKLSDLKKRFSDDIVIAERIGAKISDRSKEFETKVTSEDPNVRDYLAAVREENDLAYNNQYAASQTQITSEADYPTTPQHSKKKHKSKHKKTKHSANNYLASQEKIKAEKKQQVAARKMAAKAKITSPDAIQAAEATGTNIVKAKQQTKAVADARKELTGSKFQLVEGNVDLKIEHFLFPDSKSFYSVSWLDTQDQQCAALFL